MINEIDERKTKYFVIAIVLLILIGICLVIHFNNKSLVSPNEKEKTTTTTKVITTKKKTDDTTSIKKVNKVVETEEVKEETIYKSAIDKDSNVVFNYKLTDEIKDTDIIVAKLLEIKDNNLISNNVIGLYDISLYDVNMNIKSLKNSLLSISIPIDKSLLGYDEYKIVYIDDNNVISDEEFKTEVKDGYIKFETTHLSKYGIIGIKNKVENPVEDKEEVIDLSKVNIDLKINDQVVIDYTDMYVSVWDKINIDVKELDSDYKLYYLLKDEVNSSKYIEFDEELLSTIKTPSQYTLFIKLEVSNNSKVFEIGNINVYDIVFNYDKDEEIKEDIEIGKIVPVDGTEYTYEDKNINNDIVIKPVPEETEADKIIEDKINNSVEELDETVSEDVSKNENVEIDDDLLNNEDSEEQATIKVNGNIYLVEKTDISKLEMTGHLIIDTSDDITFAVNSDAISVSNIYTITIKSKEFSLNGVKYTYEYDLNGDLVIKRVEEKEEDNKELTKEDFEKLFDGYKIESSKDSLILGKEVEK